MFSHDFRTHGVRQVRTFVCALCVVVLASLTAMGGETSLKKTTSLGFVPADVSFYSGLMRGREIYDRVAQSNAIAKLRKSAAFQMGMAALKMKMLDPDNPLAQFMSEMEKPENRELVALIEDMLSHEAFVYGDREWTELYKMYFDMYREIYGEMFSPENFEQLAAGNEEAVVGMMGKYFDRFAEQEIPTLVAGFRITDAARTERQLTRLEKILEPLVDSVPAIEGRLKRKTVAGTKYLTFKLDGKMIPWDQLEGDITSDAQRKLFEKFRRDIERREVVFSLGVRGDYVLLSMTRSMKYLDQLGSGPLLVDRDEMAPVVKMSDRPLTSIAYMSKGFVEQMTIGDNTVDTWVSMGKAFTYIYTLSEEITEARRDLILSDIEAIGEDLKTFIPDAGTYVAFSFLTDCGIEGYQYDWGENLTLDGSKSLTLLDHVGGRPISFAVARSKYKPENYDLLVKWVKKSMAYLDLLAAEGLDDDQKQQYAQAKKAVGPLLARIDNANREMIIPAVRDGQVAFVLDAKMTSQSWCAQMPPSEQPLPMAELAVVCGVSDAKLLKKGVAEYVASIEAALAKAHELAPEDVPLMKIPRPQTRRAETGKLYVYPLPEPLGIDKQIAPNAGLSTSTLVLSVSPGHTKRLLTKTPLATEGLIAAERDRPLAAAMYFSWPALIEAVEPWADLALAYAQDADPDAAEPGADQTYAQMTGTVTDLLKCLGRFSSVLYIDDDAKVTHYEWCLQDVPE
jgi:hypothetical protein